MIVVGIDPGKSGAVVRINTDGSISLWKKFKELADIAAALKAAFSVPEPAKAIIEGVSSQPGEGVKSVFSFGKSTGVAFGSLFSLASPGTLLEEVWPQKWQNWYRNKFGLAKGAGTFDSTEVIKMVLPESEWQKCMMPRAGRLDHNATDAALIAYWGLHNTGHPLTGADD